MKNGNQDQNLYSAIIEKVIDDYDEYTKSGWAVLANKKDNNGKVSISIIAIYDTKAEAEAHAKKINEVNRRKSE